MYRKLDKPTSQGRWVFAGTLGGCLFLLGGAQRWSSSVWPSNLSMKRICLCAPCAYNIKENSETKNKQTTSSKERLRFEAPPSRGCSATTSVCENGERKRKPKGHRTARGCVPLCCWTDEEERQRKGNTNGLLSSNVKIQRKFILRETFRGGVHPFGLQGK
ncbi:hypothetical protein LR48_Vigan03g134700 [Vigna angularis]|uniref:Uncharacterized protein n=1 Tax=Phaseolus angularis TaxID=3914 RepID=A0A0L9U5C5_PHAAN|nr:hypothetical protein LR48_Vigan03g134700 [Vigna angularis]